MHKENPHMSEPNARPPSGLSRRSLLARGSAAAAGAAGLTVGLPAGLGAAERDQDQPLSPEELDRVDPALVDIRDAATGEVEILIGERSVVVTDPVLVARILRAGA